MWTESTARGGGRGGVATHSARQDVVDDDDLTLQRRSNHRSALAVILLLLAVVAEVAVDAVLLGERHRSDGGEGDALVGRAKEDVEVLADRRGEKRRRVRVRDGREK